MADDSTARNFARPALRVAAIDFLNPAPLMWDFNHAPLADELKRRYDIRLTAPSQCARDLNEGRADLGLIPIAALTPELSIVPGCTIASLRAVRSIQLIVKRPRSLSDVRTVSADTASRSSVAYAQVLFREFLKADPTFVAAPANAEAMLAETDAALLIGDPALLAMERREAIEAAVGPCDWYDVASEWNRHTGLPWVAAVWAARADAIVDAPTLVEDLNRSREHGLANTDALVDEWTTRIALPAATIQTYLTENIHYQLDGPCLEAIQLFRELAARNGVLPPLPDLRFLTS